MEFLAPRCASFRPRFGEEGCFFAKLTAKYVWFYLPMSILLLVNDFVFISLAKMLFKLDRKKRRLGNIEGRVIIEKNS